MPPPLRVPRRRRGRGRADPARARPTWRRRALRIVVLERVARTLAGARGDGCRRRPLAAGQRGLVLHRRRRRRVPRRTARWSSSDSGACEPHDPATRIHTHAVLYISDAQVSSDFYQAAFDFEVVEQMGRSAVFLRSRHGTNHHDLGLFSVGPDAAPLAPRRVGLYHLAWEVPTIEALAEARTQLVELGALVGQSDHGVSKRSYARTTPTGTSSKWCGTCRAKRGATTSTTASSNRSIWTPRWRDSGVAAR